MKQTIINESIHPVLSVVLTAVLADTMALYIKTREIPWNIIDNRFIELENLLEDRNKKLEESIQEIAVRKNNLGMPVSGTLEIFLKYASLKALPEKYPNKNDMLKELLIDHETILTGLRKNINDCYEKYGDKCTGDFLKSQLKKHEAITYNLRIFLSGEIVRPVQQIAC